MGHSRFTFVLLPSSCVCHSQSIVLDDRTGTPSAPKQLVSFDPTSVDVTVDPCVDFAQ
jgi:hypothetical protein